MRSAFLHFCSILRQCIVRCFVYTWSCARRQRVELLQICRFADVRRYVHEINDITSRRVTHKPTNLSFTLHLVTMFELVDNGMEFVDKYYNNRKESNQMRHGVKRITKREFDLSNPKHFRRMNARGVWMYFKHVN